MSPSRSETRKNSQKSEGSGILRLFTRKEEKKSSQISSNSNEIKSRSDERHNSTKTDLATINESVAVKREDDRKTSQKS